MSLVRIALRICAVQALRGRTLAGANVLDSKTGAPDAISDAPFISVHTEDGEVENGGRLRAMVANGRTELVFEAGFRPADASPDTDGGLPLTDADLEFRLDLVMRQICDALDDDASPWADLLRSLCPGFVSVQRTRIPSDHTGIRLAGHRLRLTVELVADPLPGMLKDNSPMARFIAKCESDLVPGDPQMAEKIAQIRAAISGTGGEVQPAIRRYGLTFEEADALLLATPGDTGTDATMAAVRFGTAEAGDGG